MLLLTLMTTDLFILLPTFYSFLYSVEGDLLGREKDEMKYAYACLDKQKVNVECDRFEAIEILDVGFGGEPLGCANGVTDDNDCRQFSPFLTEGAKRKCDGGIGTCEVQVVPISADELEMEDLLPVQDNCAVGGQFLATVFMDHMVVRYKCQAFKYCTAIDETAVRGILTVTTKNFPKQVISNPKCQCTFSSGSEIDYVLLNAQCNGTITFVADETLANTEDGPEFITLKKRYYCNNNLGTDEFQRIGTNKAISIEISIDTSNTSEYSSFSLQTLLTSTKIRNGYPTTVRNADGEILVSCVSGGLWLPRTVVIILSTTIPSTVVLLIVLIVVCRYVKRRRKKAVEWRRKFVPLRGQSQRSSYQAPSTCASPSSPRASHSSTPSSTRKKPDGKLDSDSEEDLTQIAARLHRQNTERKAEEMRKRQAYHNNNSHVGLLPSLPAHMNVPHSYSQQYDLGQQGQDSDRMACKPADRRCMSIGNLRPTGDADASDDETRSSRFSRPRSVSQSRQNFRSRRPVTPTVPALYGSQIHVHKNNFNSINHDQDDPDLTFDDPRYKNRSRTGTPVRELAGNARPHLYGEQIANSVGNLRHAYNSEYHTSLPLPGTRSVSQSRTSLRSTKRRAPLPPGQSPSTSRKPVGRSSSSFNTPAKAGPGTPAHSRPSSPRAKEHRQASAAGASCYVPNSKKKISAKPKYFNPYAVKYPPVKTKKQHSFSEDNRDSHSSPLVMDQDLPRHDRRRYSDDGSLDESEHGLEDIQTGVLGDLDVDMMDDDQW